MSESVRKVCFKCSQEKELTEFYKHSRMAVRYLNELRKRRPDMAKAWRAVQYAKRKGTLVPQPCEHCGATEDIQAHHHDYSKPLDVEWLCFRCHREHGHGQHVA